MLVIEAAEAWDGDPEALRLEHDEELKSLRASILAARDILPEVEIEKDLVRQIIDACLNLGITTHRAEITVVRTAKTIAAFQGENVRHPPGRCPRSDCTCPPTSDAKTPV
ncbi:hypothetical protein [Methanoculleus chikugoensis]|uniref:hypothetical protein n=1 Tax=Methanoculleus chikugoensis TaxID=118126 RepID=UPI001FB50150|nr:hypothetical protein [Methanoculleus chikugoensis]